MAKQAIVSGKGRAIKGAAPKNLKQTMPDPSGRRIEIVVDEEMLKKAADNAKVKVPRGTKRAGTALGAEQGWF